MFLLSKSRTATKQDDNIRQYQSDKPGPGGALPGCACPPRPIAPTMTSCFLAPILAQGFPLRLAARARAVAGRLVIEQPRLPPFFSVRLAGEDLLIPERLYCEPGTLMAATEVEGVEGLIALCLGTRHHDGFVRERCLRRLLAAREDWIVPFVVRLVGEYVVEIVALIEAALPELDTAAYGAFLRENPRFLALTEQRVLSYWFVYLEAGYRERGAEPGSVVIGAFKRMAAGASPDSAG